jgi:metallo-beta-lactamase class B
MTFNAHGQLSETERSWNLPVEPFRIVGNVYYVGASDIASYLIATPKGHILIDSSFLETVPQIEQNIAKLGFKLSDIKILLNSHAHYDHAGGLAELRRRTEQGCILASPMPH